MKLHSKITPTLLMFLMMLILFSCFQDENLNTNKTIGREGSIVLGKKLDNPFSVKNMQLAYENLRTKSDVGRIKDELDIQTTHLYVRFLPENYAMYDTLTSDSTIYFVDHPIDYEIEQAGDFYHDPAIPDTLPTYQYTAVPVDYVAPEGITFEVLEELYLPREDTTLAEPDGRISNEAEQLIDELEYEALSITGNLPEEAEQNNDNGRTMFLPSKFTPSGRIIVNDTQVGDLPLAGAKVRTRRWFEVHEAITGLDGNFRASGTYRYDFNYEIVWERAQFDIRSGTFGQATMSGPNCKCSWNPTIQNGLQRFYASIFRAAHRYFFGNIDGLRRPMMISKMKISAYDTNGESNGDNWGDWDNTGLTPDIRIWRFVNSRERGTDEIFSTTIHEIAHSTHIQLMNAGLIQFAQVSKVIVESWAVAVQWHLTSMEYRERGIFNYGAPNYFNGVDGFRVNFAYQYWNQNIGTNYTSLFIDLIDNNNQIGQTFPPTSRIGTITDLVNGYTFVGIESGFLKHVYGLSSLRERLKENRPAGVTNNQIDQLVDQY